MLKRLPKKVLLSLIDFYQAFLSPDQGIFSRSHKYCTFYPTCSEYTKAAIEYGGAWYGIKKGLTRISHCHPFQKNHLDPFRP